MRLDVLIVLVTFCVSSHGKPGTPATPPGRDSSQPTLSVDVEEAVRRVTLTNGTSNCDAITKHGCNDLTIVRALGFHKTSHLRSHFVELAGLIAPPLPATTCDTQARGHLPAQSVTVVFGRL